MKNINYAIFILLLFSLEIMGQQTIFPLENKNTTDEGSDENPNNYFKDINNVLGKYLGVWEGDYNGNHFVFTVKRAVPKIIAYSMADSIEIDYVVTNANGAVLVDTTKPQSEFSILEGFAFSKNNRSYRLHYSGPNDQCGNYGVVHIQIRTDPNVMELRLFLNHHNIIFDDMGCEVPFLNYLPVDLYKQIFFRKK